MSAFEPTMGDVLEWQKCMVLVLCEPFFDPKEEIKMARCMYIWMPKGSKMRTTLFEVLPQFRTSGKEPWPKPLSDKTQALVMRMLLTHGG